MLNIFILRLFASLILVGVATSVVAHTYFFGVTELNVNSKTQHLEIVHQFTVHDIENTIAQQQQTHFSPEHPQYNKFIQAYFEKNFILSRNDRPIKLNWLGFEIKRGHLFAYQESNNRNFLINLVVKNTILTDTYTQQINTVNYQELTTGDFLQGSLTFNHVKQRSAINNPKS
ncbi:MAG: hypothetical protein QF552_07120 [Litorilituus sp.]|jgi:hypothetical protein|nr:hypothetical protein [Litorilituus sp.]